MKKILLLIALIFAMNPDMAHAQNPIPSWNVPVYSQAGFQELTKGDTRVTKNDRGKRVLHVNIRRGTSTLLPGSTVWVYSLDGLDVMGPFQVNTGAQFSVEIDDRDWGVWVVVDSPVEVDVWIE